GREQLRQFGETMVHERLAAQGEQPASRASRARVLRDQLGRQLVVEVVDGQAHAAIMHAKSAHHPAGMAELGGAGDSKSAGGYTMWVRFPLPAPMETNCFGGQPGVRARRFPMTMRLPVIACGLFLASATALAQAPSEVELRFLNRVTYG